MLEWLAHGALHQNPGLLFHGCNELRVLHGVIVDQEKPLMLRMGAGKTIKQDGFYMLPVELRSLTSDGRDLLYARAEAVLAQKLPSPPPPLSERDLALQAYPHSVRKVYEELLFHGPELQGLREVCGWSERGIVGEARSAPPPMEWIQRPLRQRWL